MEIDVRNTKIKFKIFGGDKAEIVKKEADEFVQENKIIIVDTKFDTAMGSVGTNVQYSILLIYRD